MTEFSHVDQHGKVNMVDVGQKAPQRRCAVAHGEITVSKEVLGLIRDNMIKKGDVLTVAQIAGIQAAKETSRLIPLCHPLVLDKVDDEKTVLRFELDGNGEIVAMNHLFKILTPYRLDPEQLESDSGKSL